MKKSELNMRELVVIEEMCDTVKHIKNRFENADCCYSADEILNNMNQYFTGMSVAMGYITSKEYHWGNNDEDGYYVVVIDEGRETKYFIY